MSNGAAPIAVAFRPDVDAAMQRFRDAARRRTEWENELKRAERRTEQMLRTATILDEEEGDCAKDLIEAIRHEQRALARTLPRCVCMVWLGCSRADLCPACDAQRYQPVISDYDRQQEGIEDARAD